MILLDLVEQSPVTDLQQPGRRFAVPAGLFERGGDGIALRLSFDALDQRLQAGDARLRFGGLRPSTPDFSAAGGMYEFQNAESPSGSRPSSPVASSPMTR